MKGIERSLCAKLGCPAETAPTSEKLKQLCAACQSHVDGDNRACVNSASIPIPSHSTHDNDYAILREQD